MNNISKTINIKYGNESNEFVNKHNKKILNNIKINNQNNPIIKKETGFSCNCCNYKTLIKCCILKHYVTTKHINNFKKSKYCDICKKDYNNIGNFRRHYKSHHKNNKDIHINYNYL